MAETIKGLNIVIGAETTGLDKALSGVNKQSRDLQSELKQVDKLLKLDPGNTEMVLQKQQLLAKAIENTKDKLDTLKLSQQQVNQQFANGEINEGQYRAFQREVTRTEQELQNLEQQLRDANGFSSFGQQAEEAAKKLDKFGKGMTDAGKEFSTKVTAPILGLGAAAVMVGNDFEAQMSRVKAISGATGEEFQKLNDQALQLGSDTAFSAKQAAEGMENLASAGFSTTEIMSAMDGMLDLAASSGEDLASSADIAASTLRGFGLEASNSGHVADVLAKTSADTNASVSSIGEAMKYVAPIAHQAGISLEEVTASIGIMANAGIQGSQAGTTLRGALSRLSDPSKEAATAMASINFSAFDAKGNMLSLSQIINSLSKSTAGLTNEQKQQVVSQIFGQEAMSGMMVLMQAGAKDLDNLTKSLQTSDGAAKQMAKTMQDNTKSSIEQMTGSLETAGIKIQQALAPAITAVAKKIQELADWFSKLSPATQNTILVIAGIVAAIGPVLIIIGQMVTGISALITAFTAVSSAIAVAGGVMAVITGPIGIAIAAIAALAAGVYLIINNWSSIQEFFTNLWNWVAQSFTESGQKIAEIFNVILSTVSKIWQDLSSSVIKIVIGFVKVIAENFGGFFKGILMIFDGMKLYFSGVWELIKNIFLGSILLLIDLVTGNFTKLGEDSKGIWENIKGALGKIWEGIKLVFTGALQAIAGYLAGVWTTIKSVAGSAWEGIKSMFANIWEGIKNVSKGIWDAITDGITKAIDWIKNLPSTLFNYGVNIIQGLIDGIKSMISKVAKVVSDLADQITGKIRSALGIHSPSRVMMEIGRYTAEGMAIGIDQNKNRVTKAMGALASDVTRTAGDINVSGTGVGSSGNSLTIINQGTIVGSSGMEEFTDFISRKIGTRFSLSIGGGR
ncbi:MAG TPA: phage tail tape measure protein [Clostridiales bacterium]|nr:MAG: phage tail tape measure protein [Clostridiales bacterium GWD2_32_59]HAN09360.1 phage tail tape measure protein [Clostridiales bacterium]